MSGSRVTLGSGAAPSLAGARRQQRRQGHDGSPASRIGKETRTDGVVPQEDLLTNSRRYLGEGAAGRAYHS